MVTPKQVSAAIGSREIILETGRLANQAHGAVTVKSGDTVVLVTAVTQPTQREVDFMPLVVDYQEMSYASGRIPGNFFRREIGRPSEREVLVCRLIDRPIRPLFPEGFNDEVQIIATVLSAEPDVDPDVLAVIGASAALHISKTPFNGPIAGIRVGLINGAFIANPTIEQLGQSQINLVMAASKDAVVMVEGESQFLSEDTIAEAIAWGHAQMQPMLKAQDELRSLVGQEKLTVKEKVKDTELETLIADRIKDKLAEALFVKDKMQRRQAKDDVKQALMVFLKETFAETPERLTAVPSILKGIEKKLVRSKIKDQNSRIDGRNLTTVRPISIEAGLLPRTHGSSLFTRGETKALGIVTLGSTGDEQRVESISGESFKRFLLHYNFPPYSVGEVKMLRGPSRREIGHGILAHRALAQVLPSQEDFPFTIRIVSQVLESNGSSSMATVCAGSLALMDAGVPIKAAVAGIAMGLIKEGDEYRILTDILGDEDHLGDMDFKVAGTAEGVTAIQMDIKISGIPADVLKKALNQAREARLHILGEMNKALDKPRAKLSEYAPKMEIVFIDPEKIREVIGPGGKNIKAMTAATGSSIDIEDSGKISIFSPTSKALEETVALIQAFNQKAELGKDYVGKVKKLLEFGAVVEILPGLEGLVHISQWDTQRVERIEDVAKLGDEVKVKVIEVDGGRIRMSRKAVLIEADGGTFDISEAARPGGNRGRDRGGRPPRR